MGIKLSSNKFNLKKQPSTSLIPTSPIDIEVEHLETFILVWLDPNIENDEQHKKLQKHLRQYVTYLVTFTEARTCEQWIKKRPTDEKLLLIVSGRLGKRVIPVIHTLPSIIGIYLFCKHPEYHAWTMNFSKVRDVISGSDELVRKISTDQIYFENMEDSKAIKIVKDRRHTRVLDPDSASFIWYQLFLEILTSSSYLQSHPSSDELIQILHRNVSNDQESLNLIKEFEETYDKHQAVTWLTNNTSLARFLNKAMREQNIPMLFYLRFFLIDIHNQMVSHQKPSAHVYRKQLMASAEIEKIRSNLDQYLVLNGFLLTTTKRPEISPGDNKNNQFQTVFIEIDAEYRDGIAPFACVEENDSLDILFMCGSVFKIVSFINNHDSTWILQLSLAGGKDLKILFDRTQQLRQNKDLLMIVDLLDQCNQKDKADLYCEFLLRDLPDDDETVVPHLKERLNIKSKVSTVTLHSAQFILIDLSSHLSPLASAMLETLRSLTNDSILIFDNSSNINFDTLPNKTIFLFTSSQCASSMTNTPKQITKRFILEEDKNNVDNRQRFDDSEDLIFQLADELHSCYKWEADKDSKSDDVSSANVKEEIANRIHPELQKIHQNFSTNNDNKPPICTATSLIWLKSNTDDRNTMAKVQKLYQDIVVPIIGL